MFRFLAVVLCTASILAVHTPAQVPSSVEPIRVQAGTILAFHLQTRLRRANEDPLDVLPQGTIVHVKILNSVDSTLDRDGSEFRGAIVSDLAIGDGVVIHSDAEVRGLLVLLRSKNHPDGFRYELLLTQVTDGGKSYPLTASLNASFFDPTVPSAANTKTENKELPKELPKPAASGNTRIPVNSVQ